MPALLCDDAVEEHEAGQIREKDSEESAAGALHEAIDENVLAALWPRSDFRRLSFSVRRFDRQTPVDRHPNHFI